MKYTFSGHDSFPCKALWLKKGYDFIIKGRDFNAPDSVIELGVGKNMVSAIRYWLRAFGITRNDKTGELASFLFDAEKGKDPYVEDLGTIWLLHFLLVTTGEATLYNWIFIRLQKERKYFDRQNVINFVHRLLIEDNKQSIYNENTIKKDVGVLLQNYVLPIKANSFEDYNTILMDLDLISTNDGKTFQFNIEGKRQVPWQIFLYAIIVVKGADETVDYNTLQEIGLIFCMSDLEVMEMCQSIEANNPQSIRYSDTAGIRQIQFIKKMNAKEVLNEYYG